MIPEPQKTYVLELYEALGASGDSFVIAGAQAMKFFVREARATRDIDFVLDAVRLRGEPGKLRSQLEALGYAVVPESQNFQFQKQIPGRNEVMRIEFMAPEEFKTNSDFRVDIQTNVHARACTGGSIALAQSSPHTLSGTLPNGKPFTVSVHVTDPHALVMLKLPALEDRYQNIRGPREAAHDREEARTHAADIVAILSAQSDLSAFRFDFLRQFGADTALKDRAVGILTGYFRDALSPGLILYEEELTANAPFGRDLRSATSAELERVVHLFAAILLAPVRAPQEATSSPQYRAHAQRLEMLRKENYALRLKPIIPVESENDPTRIARVGKDNLVVTMRNSQEVEIPLANISNLFVQELRREATLQLTGRLQWLSDGRGTLKFFHEPPDSEFGVGKTWGSNQAPVVGGYWALPQHVAPYSAKGWELYYGPDGRFLQWNEHILMVNKPGRSEQHFTGPGLQDAGA